MLFRSESNSLIKSYATHSRAAEIFSRCTHSWLLIGGMERKSLSTGFIVLMNGTDTSSIEGSCLNWPDADNALRCCSPHLLTSVLMRCVEEEEETDPASDAQTCQAQLPTFGPFQLPPHHWLIHTSALRMSPHRHIRLTTTSDSNINGR